MQIQISGVLKVNDPHGHNPKIRRTVVTIDNADFSLENVSADDGKREILYLSENLVAIVVIGSGMMFI